VKRYLVGGAVRDRLLGLPVRERDWVVVGATPEAMLAQGYRPVGRDFPVFLHPETGEEHALARTERKSGHGYHGFVFHADTSVTLEQDLQRRDLTVNAIAEDEHGRLIDPCGGQADLAARRLRHVSPAFAEDPLRVLRVARFAARLAPQGFGVAPETRALMARMVTEGEVAHLVPERVWRETARALLDAATPSVYFQILRDCGALAVLFPELDALFGVPQRANYHPEVDSGVHTLMCVDAAARHGFGLEVRTAALCHDYGKALTPRAEWPGHAGHDQRGLAPVSAFCARLRVPQACRDVALAHTREHLLIHRLRELRPRTLLELLERLQAFRDSPLLERVCEASLCDARGRLGFEHCDYPQVEQLRAAARAAAEVQARDVMRPGLVGPAIGQALFDARIERLKRWRSEQQQ
jgi:tRNA nucleotidyltransferase (CCA-adding enzyme)